MDCWGLCTSCTQCHLHPQLLDNLLEDNPHSNTDLIFPLNPRLTHSHVDLTLALTYPQGFQTRYSQNQAMHFLSKCLHLSAFPIKETPLTSFSNRNTGSFPRLPLIRLLLGSQIFLESSHCRHQATSELCNVTHLILPLSSLPPLVLALQTNQDDPF